MPVNLLYNLFPLIVFHVSKWVRDVPDIFTDEIDKFVDEAHSSKSSRKGESI